MTCQPLALRSLILARQEAPDDPTHALIPCRSARPSAPTPPLQSQRPRTPPHSPAPARAPTMPRATPGARAAALDPAPPSLIFNHRVRADPRIHDSQELTLR